MDKENKPNAVARMTPVTSSRKLRARSQVRNIKATINPSQALLEADKNSANNTNAIPNRWTHGGNNALRRKYAAWMTIIEDKATPNALGFAKKPWGRM